MRTGFEISLDVLVFFLFNIVIVTSEGIAFVVTDIHYDDTYHTTKLSCNFQEGEKGKFGDEHCDAPWELVVSSVTALRNIEPNPAFIVWNGDTAYHAMHDPERLDFDKALELVQNTTTLIRDTFPHSIIVPSIGNHDYEPYSQLLPYENVGYTAIADMWNMAGWLDTPEMQSTFRRGGYYTKMLSEEKRVRFIVVNSNLWMRSNKEIVGYSDPAGQIGWLTELLSQAEAKNESVYLITHGPSGTHGAFVYKSPRGDYNNLIYSLVVKFSEVIINVIAGHEHYDQFRIFYSDDGTPVAYAQTIPAVSPWRYSTKPIGDPEFMENLLPAHNPSFRSLTLNSDFLMTDYTQYYLDLDGANKKGEAKWKIHYSYLEHYGMEGLSTDSFHKLLLQIESSDAVLDKYILTSNVLVQNQKCDSACRRGYVCSIKNIRYQDYDRCMVETETSACTTPIPPMIFVLFCTSLMGKILM